MVPPTTTSLSLSFSLSLSLSLASIHSLIHSYTIHIIHLVRNFFFLPIHQFNSLIYLSNLFSHSFLNLIFSFFDIWLSSFLPSFLPSFIPCFPPATIHKRDIKKKTSVKFVRKKKGSQCRRFIHIEKKEK